jgi:hypothetical protein
MFYEAIGAQLGRAAEALAADDPNQPLDARAQQERRQTIKLLRRIGAIWPALFRALDEESAILEATLRNASEAVRAQKLTTGDESPSAGSSDPLARYRMLLCEIDELVILLHRHSQEPWAETALRSLRRGLADAADVQGRLVDDMLAI